MPTDDPVMLSDVMLRCMQALDRKPFAGTGCFDHAFNMLLTLRTLPKQTPWDGQWRLCHGVTLANGQRRTYAWLEHHDVAFDVQARTLYAVAEYYDALGVVRPSVKRYTMRMALRHQVQLGHAGPFLDKMRPPATPLLTDAQPPGLSALSGLAVA